jgi:signal transduction histidine kinase/DNA-binding response OmpR family regulator
MKTILASFQKKIDAFLGSSYLSKIEFMRKRVAFNWTVGSLISIIILTILAYAMSADIIGHFGITLLLFYVIIIPLYKSRNYDLYQAIFLAAIIITAFIYMLIFGGYTHSAGLAFVGLTCVIASTLNKSVKAAFLLFLLYVATIIGLAILNPFLKPHPDITPSINFTFFIINTIWISAAMMFFINTYLADRNKYQLAETNRLQELDDAKTQLFTNITHEFRTPITLIDGMAGQIKVSDPETKSAVHMIRKQSKRLLSLVNQILDLAKIDTNTLKVHLVNANVMEYLTYQVESFRSASESKGIEFKLEMPFKDLTMDFDQEKLGAIIVNLLNNALKFTEKGGAINIRVDKTPDEFFVVVVEDTGIGIAPEDQQKIFDRFFQVKGDQYLEGNGIGLTIVKEYVYLLGGKIDLQSEEGKGTKFMIMLPIANDAPVIDIEDQLDNSHLSTHEDRMEVDDHPLLLVIDDNREIVEYLRKILRHQYRVIESNDGHEGLEMAKKHVPDIIISDVMMPKMDGFEFLKKIKSDVATSHIPVLMLTARADQDSKLEGLNLGADAYLTKPFDREELFIRLKKLIDMRKMLHERFQKINSHAYHVKESVDIEDQFMNRISAIIDENLDDENFNIKKLCLETGMSHTQLYRKFSAITDITVNKYIRQYRLHKAKELLLSTNLNISQVALEVGMPNLAYFSRVFTDEFHTNPSKIRLEKAPGWDAQ